MLISKAILMGYFIGITKVNEFLFDPISYMGRVSDSVCVSVCVCLSVFFQFFLYDDSLRSSSEIGDTHILILKNSSKNKRR